MPKPSKRCTAAFVVEEGVSSGHGHRFVSFLVRISRSSQQRRELTPSSCMEEGREQLSILYSLGFLKLKLYYTQNSDSDSALGMSSEPIR